MKKNIVRSSMLAVAALSLMLGGTSYTSSVKEQVSETPAIVSKAIENGTSNMKSLEKGTAVQVAEATTEAPTEATTEAPTTEAATEEVASAEIEQKAAKVDSNQVVANIDSYLNIRSEASEDSEVVGKFYNGNVGTVVEKGDEWSVVSSGNAYGYVKNDYLLFGADAEQYIENNCDQVAKVTAETLNVRADESTDSEVVTQSDADASLAVLGQDNGWVKVAVSDDQVGYVSSDYVYLDYVYETAVTVEEEQAALAAQEQEEAAAQEAENQTTEAVTETTEAPSTEAATTQTTEAPKKESTKKESTKKETVDSTDVVVKDQSTSTETVKQDSSTSASGQAVADYAVQFVGNPYVYGGTSLTKGADCSGFVQSVYKHFGYSLSRTAASQAGDGKKVSLDSLQPGDLLFYHGYGHVAIYIGGGQVVHASNKATGIKISSYDYSPIDKAVRIIY